MAVYVDRAKVQFRGREWCHLMADTLEELHAFAQSLEIDARLFHRTASYPHYDITLEMRILVRAWCNRCRSQNDYRLWETFEITAWLLTQ